MAFNRPTLDDLVTRISTDMVSRLGGTGTLLRNAVLKVLARVFAGAIHLVYGYLNWISRQVMPDSADTENLARWAAIWGVTRIAAQFASGNVTLTGTSGTLVPAGTILVRTDGTQFTTNVNLTLASGTGTVAATAQVAGSAGNTDAGTVMALSSPIAGIQSAVTAATGGIANGTDTELDSSLLSRLLTRIQTPPAGGSANDYLTWALQVAGTTRAWVLPLYTGAGTVGLTFVQDGNVGSIIPNAGAVAAMQAYITDPSRAPVTAYVTVFAPTADVQNFSISGISDLTVQAGVIAQLTDLIKREASPGGTVLLSHINQAIQLAAGSGDHVLISPAANIVAAAGHLTTMGTVTFS